MRIAHNCDVMALVATHVWKSIRRHIGALHLEQRDPLSTHDAMHTLQTAVFTANFKVQHTFGHAGPLTAAPTCPPAHACECCVFTGRMSVSANAFCGFVAGTSEAVFAVTPIETIKVQRTCPFNPQLAFFFLSTAAHVGD
jgi:hypothetical protein